MDAEISDIILNRLQAGEPEAFDLLYKQSRVRLYILALSLIKDPDAAQDLVQEFFIDFWEQRRYAQLRTSVIGYMVRSIRNRCYNYMAKKNTDDKLKNYFSQNAKDYLHMPDRIENEDLKKKLDKAVQHLPPAAGKVFQLHYIEKMSHADIAEKLNISKSTVSNHIDRALKQLRKELKDYKIL